MLLHGVKPLSQWLFQGMLYHVTSEIAPDCVISLELPFTLQFLQCFFAGSTNLYCIQVLCNAINIGGGGGGGLHFPKKHYVSVWFNVINITMVWVGVHFSRKKRYITLELSLTSYCAHWLLYCLHQLLFLISI